MFMKVIMPNWSLEPSENIFFREKKFETRNYVALNGKQLNFPLLWIIITCSNW